MRSISALTIRSSALASESGALVHYQDLNLDSPAGRAILDARIDRAARRVCGTALINELDIAAGVNACREDVIASARSQLDAILAGGDYAGLRASRTVRAAN